MSATTTATTTQTQHSTGDPVTVTEGLYSRGRFAGCTGSIVSINTEKKTARVLMAGSFSASIPLDALVARPDSSTTLDGQITALLTRLGWTPCPEDVEEEH